jgi:hypothetical protein
LISIHVIKVDISYYRSVFISIVVFSHRIFRYMDGERRKERKRRRRSRSRSEDEERSSSQPSQPFKYDRHRTKLTKMFFRPVDLIKGGDEILLGPTLGYRYRVSV